jgi:hypothetical protein
MSNKLKLLTKTHCVTANADLNLVEVFTVTPYSPSIYLSCNFRECLSFLDTVYLGDGEGVVKDKVWGMDVSQAESLAKFITKSLSTSAHLKLEADLLPPNALLKVVGVLTTGKEKYPNDKWKTQTIQQHLSHALIHIFRYFQGDKEEPHLSHAATRLLFALEIQQTKGDK